MAITEWVKNGGQPGLRGELTPSLLVTSSRIFLLRLLVRLEPAKVLKGQGNVTTERLAGQKGAV
jgi:hypothetical protein